MTEFIIAISEIWPEEDIVKDLMEACQDYLKTLVPERKLMKMGPQIMILSLKLRAEKAGGFQGLKKDYEEYKGIEKVLEHLKNKS